MRIPISPPILVLQFLCHQKASAEKRECDTIAKESNKLRSRGEESSVEASIRGFKDSTGEI